MLSRGEQVERIVTAWAQRETERGLIRTDHTTATALAMVALTALECGEEHPARPDIRCDQLPHDNGHLYHRNSDLQVEWWASGDRDTMTVHDVLGPIQLVQAPVRAGVEIRVPFIGGETKAGTRQEQHPGRYHTLPPCSDDAVDAEGLVEDLETLDEVLAQAPPACGAKHDQYDWYCDRDVHDVTGDDPSTWHRDRTRDRYWYPGSDIALSVAGGNDADRAVYRDLLPLLEPVAMFLDRMGKRYREGNPRMTSELCRTAETHRDALTDVAGKLQDLLDGPTDA